MSKENSLRIFTLKSEILAHKEHNACFQADCKIRSSFWSIQDQPRSLLALDRWQFSTLPNWKKRALAISMSSKMIDRIDLLLINFCFVFDTRPFPLYFNAFNGHSHTSYIVQVAYSRTYEFRWFLDGKPSAETLQSDCMSCSTANAQRHAPISRELTAFDRNDSIRRYTTKVNYTRNSNANYVNMKHVDSTDFKYNWEKNFLLLFIQGDIY